MKPNAQPDSKDFRQLVGLLQIYSEASASLDAIEAQAAKEYLAVITRHKDDYACLQAVLTGTEKVAEDICRAHPEWFTEKKGLKTPFGTAKLTRTTKLEVDDEQESLLLLHREAGRDKKFPVANFVREVLALNREALEQLGDYDLQKFKVARRTEQSFTITPAKVDMGKAVKEAAESKEAA